MPALNEQAKTEQRSEVLAVSFLDLERLNPELRKGLLAGRLDQSQGAIKIGNEVAVAFSCDLLSAACLCDTLRRWDVPAKHKPTRVYVKRGSLWSKVSDTQTLSVLVNGVAVLNPELFPVVADAKLRSAPAIQRAF